jgi:hypothetical protein
LVALMEREHFPRAAVERATGASPVSWDSATRSGYGVNTSRWHVTLAGGRRGFAKIALDDLAAGWLRDEHNVYANVSGSFIPPLLGWLDDDVTLLVIEDLSDAHWPPPWPADGVAAVLQALDAVHGTTPPPGLATLETKRESLDGWRRVAYDPEPFLALGLCSERWLNTALPVLLAATAACCLDGDAFLHLDVRSDNLCFSGGEAVLVDWNWAVVGNPDLDLVAWLPSLRLEGGPEPWELVPDSKGMAALIAGFFASFAGLPPPATAPNVREIQRRQAEVALPWAAREAGLSPPDARLDSLP